MEASAPEIFSLTEATLGDVPYTDLTPRRNPGDPVDRFAAGQAKRFLGAIDPEAFRENLGFQENRRALILAIPSEAAAAHAPTAPESLFFTGPRSAIALNQNFPGAGGPCSIPTFPDEPSHQLEAIPPGGIEGYVIGPDGMIRSAGRTRPRARGDPISPRVRGCHVEQTHQRGYGAGVSTTPGSPSRRCPGRR